MAINEEKLKEILAALRDGQKMLLKMSSALRNTLDFQSSRLGLLEREVDNLTITVRELLRQVEKLEERNEL